jgi:hypothetical protein
MGSCCDDKVVPGGHSTYLPANFVHSAILILDYSKEATHTHAALRESSGLNYATSFQTTIAKCMYNQNTSDMYYNYVGCISNFLNHAGLAVG